MLFVHLRFCSGALRIFASAVLWPKRTSKSDCRQRHEHRCGCHKRHRRHLEAAAPARIIRRGSIACVGGRRRSCASIACVGGRRRSCASTCRTRTGHRCSCHEGRAGEPGGRTFGSGNVHVRHASEIFMLQKVAVHDHITGKVVRRKADVRKRRVAVKTGVEHVMPVSSLEPPRSVCDALKLIRIHMLQTRG